MQRRFVFRYSGMMFEEKKAHRKGWLSFSSSLLSLISEMPVLLFYCLFLFSLPAWPVWPVCCLCAVALFGFCDMSGWAPGMSITGAAVGGKPSWPLAFLPAGEVGLVGQSFPE